MSKAHSLFRQKMKNILVVPLLFCTCSAIAQETLCVIKVSGTENTVNIKATQDPYALSTLNLEGGFRFSGQVLQDAVTKQSKLKTFTYHESKDRYVLIHASENMLDTAICTSAKKATQEFGLQRVYSHKYERELSFSCKTTCSAGVQQ
nr:hypothetical protein [uncultured Undibacterium sp.]